MPLLNTARLPNLKPENIRSGVSIAGIMGTAGNAISGTYTAGTQTYNYKKIGNFYIFDEVGSDPVYHLGCDFTTYSSQTYLISDAVAKICADFGKTLVSYDYKTINSSSITSMNNYYVGYKSGSWYEWQQSNYGPFKILTYIEMI